MFLYLWLFFLFGISFFVFHSYHIFIFSVDLHQFLFISFYNFWIYIYNCAVIILLYFFSVSRLRFPTLFSSLFFLTVLLWRLSLGIFTSFRKRHLPIFFYIFGHFIFEILSFFPFSMTSFLQLPISWRNITDSGKLQSPFTQNFITFIT